MEQSEDDGMMGLTSFLSLLRMRLRIRMRMLIVFMCVITL